MKHKKLIIIFSVIAIIIICLIVRWVLIKQKQPLLYYCYNGTSDVMEPSYSIYSNGRTVIEDKWWSKNESKTIEGQLSKANLEELKKDIKEFKYISSHGNQDYSIDWGDYFRIKGKNIMSVEVILANWTKL